MDVSGKIIQKQLETRLAEMKALLKELVNIDSGSLDKEGVNQVASVLVPRLESLGFTATRTENEECGDFVVASKKLGGKGRVVVLGHMDTVWPRGTVNKWPYEELNENIATGPGVGDMKGGLVMALFALEELLKSGFNQLKSIEFVLVPDEEIGSVYSRERIEKVVNGADAVLVLEPGRPGNGVVTARGALGNLFIKARGEEAHCAVNYEEGASAVRALAMKVDDLERLSLPKQGTIVNVGVFTGGVAKQVVPEFA